MKITSTIWILVTCLSFTALSAVGQCTVERVSLDSVHDILTTGWEILPAEKQSLNFYAIGAILTYRVTGSRRKVYGIRTKYLNVTGEKDVPPRSIVLTYADKTVTTIKASHEYPVSGLEGGKTYLYQLNEMDLHNLQSKTIASIDLVDHRTGQTVSCQPYRFLLSESLECIEKRILQGY